MKRFLRSSALAALLLTAPALFPHKAVAGSDMDMPTFIAEGPVELPDSDTSSLGTESRPDESPFMLRCMDATTFTSTVKRLKAKGMIIGEDALDKTLVMVFRYQDGSINFIRSDKQGKSLCIFGTVYEPDINIGVAIGGSEKNKF